MKTKKVPFDIEKARRGAKIVTRNGCPVRIGFFDLKDEEHPIVGAVETDGGEVVCSFTKDGRRAVEDEESRNDAFKNVFDLFIEEVKTRKMTYKELSWWLREHPEEHREYTHEDIRKSSWNVYSCYDYNTSYADEEVNEYIRIRKNGGEWQEPLIEE